MFFVTLFADKLKKRACTDNGAESNAMDSRTLWVAKETGTDVEVQKLDRPWMFEKAAITSEQTAQESFAQEPTLTVRSSKSDMYLNFGFTNF